MSNRKPKPSLSQVRKASEYAYHCGIRTEERAEELIEEYMSEGDISPSEKPRVAKYYLGLDKRFAIVLTDTGLEAYVSA